MNCIGTLIKVCKELPDVQFIFAGTGPLEETVNGIKNIKNVGFQKGEALEKLIREARFSIYPCRIGGEQSGHIIFSKYASTGDGILTSLKMMEVMLAKKKPMSELAAPLVDYYYKKYNLGPIDAIAKTMVRVRGSYALELMFRDYPGEIWVARKDSPMIIGIADGETYVASDGVL